MTARILEGKVFAQAFREDAQKKAAALQEKYGVQPGLAVIIVGSNPASQVYVRNKHKSCEALGIYSEVIEMPETTTKDELIAKIDALNADAKICHSHTKDLPAITREADILVAAVGRPKFVTADMVKPGATVIDVGINRIAPKKLVGDVDFESVKEVAGAITPVPGGVGLLTVAMLMKNVVRAAEMQLQA